MRYYSDILMNVSILFSHSNGLFIKPCRNMFILSLKIVTDFMFVFC